MRSQHPITRASRLAPLLLGLMVLATMAAVGLRERQPSLPVQAERASDFVASLNASIQAFHSELERVRLLSPCEIRLRPLEGEPVQLDLYALRLRMGYDRDARALELHIEPPGLLLVATDSWPAWAAVHSDVSQLRARCALHRAGQGEDMAPDAAS